MGMFGLAVKETLVGTKRLLLSALLLSVVFFITIVYFSAYDRQYSKYNPFRGLLEGQGHTAFVDMAFVNDLGGMDGLVKKLKKVKSYECVYALQLTGQTVSGQSIKIFGIDERIASYVPVMSEGRWITGKPGDGGNPKAAICANSMGIGSGDRLEITYADKNVSLDICGVMAADASCFVPYGINMNLNIFDYYYTYDPEREDRQLFMYMSLQDMKELNLGYYNGFFMVRYDDDISEAEFEENGSLLKNCGSPILLENKDIRERTEEKIDLNLSTITPLAAAGAVLLSFGLCCLIGIDVRSRMKQYAVYYACGMRWGQCVGLNIIQSGLSALLAVLITVCAGNMIKIAGADKLINFEMGSTQLKAGLVVFLIEMVLSAAVPLVLIKSKQPRDIIRKANL